MYSGTPHPSTAAQELGKSIIGCAKWNIRWRLRRIREVDERALIRMSIFILSSKLVYFKN
jgi:hypothetical protein